MGGEEESGVAGRGEGEERGDEGEVERAEGGVGVIGG